MSKTIRWPQYVAGLSAAGGAFITGTALGWSAPVGPRMVDEEQYFPITQAKFDWAASIVTLGCAISCLPIGYLMKIFGRKWTMLSLVVPFLIGWSLVIWAKNFVMLLIGRFLIGLAGGAFCVAAPLYSSEIAEKEIRGRIGNFFQVLLECGVLFVYVIGPFLPVFWTNIVCGAIPLVFAGILFFMPESPVFLVLNNRDEEAYKSLKWLRGHDFDPVIEVEEMKQNLHENLDIKISMKEAFEKRSSIRAIVISVGLMFFQQFSGINIVIFYTTFIFNAADTGIDADISTIIVGVVLVLAAFVALALVDRAGRKILLLVSIITMTITLTTLGVFFYLQDVDPEKANYIKWLLLTSLCIYIFAFGLGFDPIPWLMMSEVCSKEINAIVSPLAGALNWSLAFVIILTFNFISDAIGIGQTFWIFAGFSLVGTIYVFLVIPETKGKSMADIQRLLSGEKMRD